MLKRRVEKSGQVWVETVIYTLIALSLIAILLAFAKPKIDETRDKLIIEQTIESMNSINDEIISVQIAPGNKRVLSVKISKGSFYLDPTTDEISWEIEDSKYKYSEIGQEVSLGNLDILTEESQPYRIIISTEHPVDFTNDGSETDLLRVDAASAPYQFTITNEGVSESAARLRIDVSVN